MKETSWNSENKGGDDEILGVLLEISEALISSPGLDELYKAIHISLGKILNVKNFFIALYREKEDTIYFPYFMDETEAIAPKIVNHRKTASLTGRVIQSGRPRIFFEQDILDFSKKLGRGPIGKVAKVWLGAPLILKNRVMGALVIQDYQSADTLKEKDLELLNLVARHVALAIEKKETEAKFNNQAMILEKILESSPVAIALVENRAFSWVNQEMVRMFGYDSKQDLQGRSVRMIYRTREDYERAGKIIYGEIASQGIREFETHLVKRDGRQFSANIRLNRSGNMDHNEWTIAIVTDVSQKKSIEKESLEKERLQGVLEMAGAVCHEINQPLQAILGYSELMLLEKEEKKLDKRLNSIRAQASRIGNITEKLANITRYKTVEYPGKKTIVDIWNAGGDVKEL